MKYDYYEMTKENIAFYIANEIAIEDFSSRDELEEHLQDTLLTDDSVTGNGSGSYTFNRNTAKNYVTDNMELCTEALREFCVDMETVAEKFLSEDWEYFDVTIRCYILGSCISELLDDMEDDLQMAFDELEEEQEA